MDSKTASPLCCQAKGIKSHRNMLRHSCLMKEAIGLIFAVLNIDACALFCLNVVSIKMFFAMPAKGKFIQWIVTCPPLFFSLLPHQQYSINFSQCFDMAGTQHVRSTIFDGFRPRWSKTFIKPHFCKNFTSI